MSNSLQLHGLYSPWNSPGQNTRVGSLSLLQGTFPTQGSNPGLLQCRWILYQFSHKGSPRILEWVACPFSRGSSQPRDQTRLCCFAGGSFTTEAAGKPESVLNAWARTGQGGSCLEVSVTTQVAQRDAPESSHHQSQIKQAHTSELHPRKKRPLLFVSTYR